MFSADLGVTPSSANYIEDVFSTYLYTGTGATQTITNGIDLAGKGGLVWIKGRSGATDHALYDTANFTGGLAFGFASNTTEAATYRVGGLNVFLSSGFNIGGLARVNTSAATYASWSFRKQAKFFDVVTYTGTGANRTIAHNLGSVPGCIMVKRADSTGAWAVYHNSLTYANGTGAFGTTKAGENVLFLNTTNLVGANSIYWNNTDATLTNFSLGTDVAVNANGGTYVAYLFANNAGGFGLTGTEDVITCGYYIGDGTTNYSKTINLGWEPQFVLVKRTSQVTDTTGWGIADNMRGFTVGSNTNWLLANTSDAESILGGEAILITNTGFRVAYTVWNANTAGFIYIAIRRGPMKTPTTGTSVFGLSARTGTGANATVTGGQTDDAVLIKNRGSAVASLFSSRLTGTGYLVTSSTAAEVAAGTTILQANPWDVMDGVKVGTTSTITNASANTFINYLFRRAPGFFDVVCYTGTGVARTVSHNLGVAPELMIIKGRNSSLGNRQWWVYSAGLSNPTDSALSLDQSSAVLTGVGTAWWNNGAPTSSNFSVGTWSGLNESAGTYIAYLFATVAGVSKVFSYTGNGSSQTINCGFTGGARFVLIKRTDSTGNWTVFDSARGIVAGNDPALYLNSTAAEVTTIDAVDTDSSGFIVNQDATLNLNVNNATYIGLAIA